jgi:predicted small secreted protein
MVTKRTTSVLAATVAASLVVSGCATMDGEGQQQAVGAGLGAALGCGIGALITRDARGCAAGAAVGGVIGFTVVKINQYQAKQVRSVTADERLYGLTKPVDSAQVKIRSGASTPKAVRAGQAVVITTDYSVLLPKAEAQVAVAESWSLKKDGKVLYSLPAQQNERTPGGWVATATIDVPADAKPGTYVVEHKVKAGSSYDTDESTFVVKS